MLKHKINLWVILGILGVAFVALPFAYLFFNLFTPVNENLKNLFNHWASEYVINTFTILFFTALFTSSIGIISAFITTYFIFPFKKFFEVFLILPLAIPAYIFSYTYAEMFSYTGVIQATLRNAFGLYLPAKYFDIISLQGVIFIFSVTLYPYIYITVKSFLNKQSAELIETSRILGKNMLTVFFKVIIPISVPAIFGSTVLVCMEVLSDYGVTSYYGIHTFSTAILQAWFGMHDMFAAIKIALIVMFIGSVIFIAGKLFRRSKKYQLSAKSKPISPIKLTGSKKIVVVIFLSFVVFVSFFLPVTQMIFWAIKHAKTVAPELFGYTLNTLFVSITTTILIMGFALIIANVSRTYKRTAIFSVATIGYPTPSAVLAIGVLGFFVLFDKAIYSLGLTTEKLTISSTVIMLVFAYFVKFLSVGINGVESGFAKVGNKYSESSRLLGMDMTKTFFKVDFFTIKNAIIGSSMLVFVDVTKELPIMLLLRPYNFATLSTEVYSYASNEQIQKSALPSLIIISICILFICITRKLDRR